MDFLWVILCIVGYFLIGGIISKIGMRFVDGFDEDDIDTCLWFWPLVIVMLSILVIPRLMEKVLDSIVNCINRFIYGKGENHEK